MIKNIIVIGIYYFFFFFILFCVFAIIIDFIFENFEVIELASVLYILPNLLDDLLFCYQKYLIDKKYHSYWNILFFFVLYSFIIDFVELIIIIIKDPYDNSIFITIRNADKKYIILNFFLDAIFGKYLKTLFTLLILQYFSLNHVIVSHVLNYLVYFTIQCASDYDIYKNYLYFLIPAVFQIISILFFLEILEFNFCNLNKNTIRNIMLGEESEMIVRSSNASDIEIDKDLIIKSQQENINFELCDMKEKDEDINNNDNNNGNEV